MRLISALLATALAVSAAPAPALAGPAAAAHKPAATVIRNPKAFVQQVYARLIKGGDYQPPEDIYTPRLNALWASMDRDARGEVPRVDFLFWINGQDGDITDVQVTDAPVEQRPQGDRTIVVARFRNSGAPQELHFYFERTAAGWKLDDAECVTATSPWTLSVILKYGVYWEQPKE